MVLTISLLLIVAIGFGAYFIINKVKKGDVLVNYSRGGRSTDNYVKNVPLKVYTANSDGKTINRYYRPLNDGMQYKMLPNVTVTPNK